MESENNRPGRRKWIITVLASATLTAGLWFALKFEMKTLARRAQAEAKTNLGAVFTGEVHYLGENNTYGNTFDRIAWRPEGQCLYTYYQADDEIKNKDVLVDADPSEEIWTIGENNQDGATTGNLW